MIVAVAALRTELLFVFRPWLRVGVGAGAGCRLQGWLDVHRPQGAVIVGFSGATRASVAAGTLVLPEAIVTQDGDRLLLDRERVARARAALPHAVVGTVATVAGPTGLAEKARLGVETVAVDMESSHLARELLRREVPFLLIRVILDELWEDVFVSPRVRWARRALACAHRLGAAAAALRPILEKA